MRWHARPSCLRCPMVAGRASAAGGARQAQGRPPPYRQPRCADRHPVRAADRHTVGDAAARDGVRLRGDVLASAAGLAGGRYLGPTTPRTAAPSAPGGPARLEPGLPGQLVHRGQKGGEETSPNPTDRGRPGTKRHLVTDRQGIPLAFLLTGANVHDSKPLDELLDTVPSVRGKRGRPRRRPAKLHADKAYDFRRCRQACRRRGIKARIARRGVESSQKLGRHRWVVERTFAWLNRFRRLTIRYERRLDIHHTFTALACSMICLRALGQWF